MLAFCAFATAQTVTGKVEDGSGKPVGFANVVLLSLPDSAFVKGAVTAEDGTFTIDAPCNNGLVKVSSVGYQTAYKRCTGAQMGVIRLKDETLKVGEVVINGTRPSYHLTTEGLTTTVEGTVLSRLGTAEDVLKHVPSLRKTKDGYEVFGKGTPLIYINGRKVDDLTELDNLRSSDIKSVELIQNPGAKYAATVGAVIKIRTVRIKGEGLGINMRANYEQGEKPGVVGQADLNYHHNGLNLFGTYKYSHIQGFNHGEMKQTVFADTLWQQRNMNISDWNQEQHYVVAGISYDFDANNSVGARYTMTATPYNYGYGTFSSQMTADGKPYDNINSTATSHASNDPTHRLNVYYTGLLGKLSVDFNADYMKSGSTLNDGTVETSEEHDDRDIVSSSKIGNTMFAAKLIAGYPLLGGKLSLGAEYINTKRDDDYRVNRNDILPNAFSTLKEVTAAPFVEYSHPTPIGNVTAGVRYEHVQFKYYDQGVYVPGQSRDYGNFFPSLSISRQAGDLMAQLSYSVKTERPDYSQLTNKVSYANRFTWQKGNPLLKNSIKHSVEAMAMYKWLNLMLNYSDTRDAIVNWATQKADNEAITVLSRQNLNSLKKWQAMLTASPVIGVWQPRLTVGAMGQWLKLDTDMGKISLQKPIFIIQMNNTMRLPWGVLFTADLQYHSKGNQDNIKIARNVWSVDLGLSKSFLKDALTVELNGSDIFNQNNEDMMLYNQKMQFLQNMRWNSRTGEFTLRYNFNTSKNRYRDSGAGNSAVDRM